MIMFECLKGVQGGQREIKMTQNFQWFAQPENKGAHCLRHGAKIALMSFVNLLSMQIRGQTIRMAPTAYSLC